MRAIAADPGRSKQTVAAQLGIHASRVVVLIDDLERAGIVERRRSPKDRRHYALHVTEQGHATLNKLALARAEHEADLCAALTDDERTQLAQLLHRVADQRGLTDGVHPGYRNLGERPCP